jgi:hypothetical protein
LQNRNGEYSKRSLLSRQLKAKKYFLKIFIERLIFYESFSVYGESKNKSLKQIGIERIGK